jgi:hypothetical protein
LLDVLASLENQRLETTQNEERLRSEHVVTLEGADADTLDLVRRMDDVQGDELFKFRTTTKARIRSLIAEIVVTVEHDGPVRRATASVRFRSGLERRILVLVRRGNPAIYHKVLPD